MSEVSRRSLRILISLFVVIVALLEVQNIVIGFRAHARLRDQAQRNLEQSLQALVPALRSLPAVPLGLHQAVERLGALASQVEIFDRSGARLFAEPMLPPSKHWPGEGELREANAGKPYVTGPLPGEPPRLLGYVFIDAGGTPLVARVSKPVPGLMADLRDRRLLLMGHVAVFVFLLLIATIALYPETRQVERPTAAALDAYEEAVHRLRQHDQALVRQHDVEKRRLEDLVEDSQAMARAGELTAGIVHEMRNGLGTIGGYASLLEQSTEGDVAQTARVIREECETLTAVIRRFVDFVKEEKLNASSFDLGRMLARVVARESRSRPGAEVRFDPTGGPTFVGDEELLERAFENLVRNAREAAGSGGYVWVEVAAADDAFAVTIADDGPGLLPDPRQALDRFYTTKAGGLGLGLPTALKIVKLHGGDLILENRLPRGLRVRVELPRNRGIAAVASGSFVT